MLEHININLTPNGKEKIKPYIHGDTKEKVADLYFEIANMENIKTAIQLNEIETEYKLLSEEELEILLKIKEIKKENQN